jgi:hypothetical protein
MFCPFCGHEISSDRVRFCTQCRFPVSSLKEFITTEAAKYEVEEKTGHNTLRQLDITVGAALMIVWGIISFIMAISLGGKWLYGGMATFLFMIGSFFGFFLLFSRLSPRRRGLSQGAILVFISSLIAAIFAQPTEGVSFLIIAAIAIPVILLWMRIVRFFFDVDTKPRKSGLTAGEPFFNVAGISAGSLSPYTQVSDTAGLNTQQVRKAEEGERFSVTEDSTELLKNKDFYNPS